MAVQLRSLWNFSLLLRPVHNRGIRSSSTSHPCASKEVPRSAQHPAVGRGNFPKNQNAFRGRAAPGKASKVSDAPVCRKWPNCCGHPGSIPASPDEELSIPRSVRGDKRQALCGISAAPFRPPGLLAGASGRNPGTFTLGSVTTWVKLCSTSQAFTKVPSSS